MKISVACLPEQPSIAQSCELIARAPLSDWMPVLDRLRQAFRLPGDRWTRIPEGANALFQLGDEVIVKLVPPNWRQQGEKERLVAPLLDGTLSLQTPRLLGGGVVDNWVFVICSRLPGSSLADVWPALEVGQKRSIMLQVGTLLRELRSVAFEADIAIRVEWRHYIATLISDCLARHRRNAMPAHLAAQVLPYIEAAGDFSPPAQPRFIHMDIHPWNLMAHHIQGKWTLSGLLDFGDAIVGQCDLFELLTPLIFMAQGDPTLVKALLDAYGLLDGYDAPTLRRRLMATALIRPDSDIGFCMQQVPISGPRDTWEQIALQLFPL
ncbi:phosphotransferase [Xanthomonas sp. CFBP 8703]|uniref:Phosphotransferase n=1 Tax=Xanthomonas bonasiae TaxID=2810351 RepID=A0ABS3AZM8_9XANT|nr:phosphotransferase [Xanthomonas bonasiae]MBN6101824.1 phosphotransferase [Xanthomonas bonasiae]